MQMTQKAIIKGAGFFDDTIEGQAIKTAQVFIEEEFDKSKPNYKGFRTVEYKVAGPEPDDGVKLVKGLLHNTFPITAEITVEISATKRGQAVVVTAIKPLGQAMPQPTLKAA